MPNKTRHSKEAQFELDSRCLSSLGHSRHGRHLMGPVIGSVQCVVMPPSTLRICPEMKSESGEARDVRRGHDEPLAGVAAADELLEVFFAGVGGDDGVASFPT